MKEIEFFELDNGKMPVDEWLLSLDLSIRQRIYARLNRMQEGCYGDVKNWQIANCQKFDLVLAKAIGYIIKKLTIQLSCF